MDTKAKAGKRQIDDERGLQDFIMVWTPTDKDTLVLFTIYDHPRDYPNSFVVRRYIVRNSESIPDEVLLAETLMGARDLLPPGVYNLGRYTEDDPVIVETWV